jgi:hypothetical protein
MLETHLQASQDLHSIPSRRSHRLAQSQTPTTLHQRHKGWRPLQMRFLCSKSDLIGQMFRRYQDRALRLAPSCLICTSFLVAPRVSAIFETWARPLTPFSSTLGLANHSALLNDQEQNSLKKLLIQLKFPLCSTAQALRDSKEMLILTPSNST